jgi:hypothetical protein
MWPHTKHTVESAFLQRINLHKSFSCRDTWLHALQILSEEEKGRPLHCFLIYFILMNAQTLAVLHSQTPWWWDFALSAWVLLPGLEGTIGKDWSLLCCWEVSLIHKDCTFTWLQGTKPSCLQFRYGQSALFSNVAISYYMWCRGNMFDASPVTWNQILDT